MTETLKNEPDEQTQESPLEDMPSFDEHMEQHAPRTHEQRLQRFMEMSGIKEARTDEEKFDEALEGLEPEQAYNILSHMNVILRGDKLHERGRRDYVSVGEHLAPDRHVQGGALKLAVESLSGIEDTKYRAAMCYYVVNGLHMFPDGNGRTSRAVYEVMENPDFDLGEAESLKHHSADEAYGHEKFEREKGIRSAEHALDVALGYVKAELIGSGKISKTMEEATATSIGVIPEKQPEIYLTEDAEKQLTPAEKLAVNRAFMEGNVALLALGTFLTQKGRYEEVAEACTIESDDDEKFVRIEVTKGSLDRANEENELAKKTFEGWTADDYRMFVKMVRAVQQRQYQHLVGFFARPDDYRYGGGKRVADYLVGREK